MATVRANRFNDDFQDSFHTDSSSEFYVDEEAMFYSPVRAPVLPETEFMSPRRGQLLDSPIRASPSPRRERSLSKAKESPRLKARDRYMI